jgi:hypothetical protein
MAASPTVNVADEVPLFDPLVPVAVFVTSVPDVIAVVILSSIHTVPDFVYVEVGNVHVIVPVVAPTAGALTLPPAGAGFGPYDTSAKLAFGRGSVIVSPPLPYV